MRSTIEWFPSSGSHKHSTHFSGEFDWSKVFLGGKKKTWHFLVHPPSFNCHSLKIQRVIHAHLFSPNNSSLMFENPTDRSRFHLKACPWKFPNQHDQVKCTQNNPFIGLRKCSNQRSRKCRQRVFIIRPWSRSMSIGSLWLEDILQTRTCDRRLWNELPDHVFHLLQPQLLWSLYPSLGENLQRADFP